MIMILFLQAALPKRSSNESVLAIQPHQADQPDNLTTEKAKEPRGLWKTLLIWGGVVVGILSIAAMAPLCHYGSHRLRPPTFTFSNVDPPTVLQRLVGKVSNIPFSFKGRPVRGSREQLYLEVLEESGEQVTFIVIVSLAVCGTFLLLLIVVLMVYMCHRSKEKQLKGAITGSQQKAPSEGILFIFFVY